MSLSSSNIKTDLFLKAEGLAPNSYQATLRALSFIEESYRLEKIADIGCGKGEQTIVLCKETNAEIIAVDFIPEFVECVKAEAGIKKLNNRLSPVLASMDNLPFHDGELDMIWAESMVNNIGFGYALKQWNRYIRPDGYMALCSYCWLKDNPPEAISEYWRNSGKEINSIPYRISQMFGNGFMPVGHFVMPDECWWNYFCPLEENFALLSEQYRDNPEAERLIEEIDQEIDLYEKYGEYYGYVFFIGQKVGS